jgi:hypothetical protein
MNNSLTIYLLPNMHFLIIKSNSQQFIYIYNNFFFFFICINNYKYYFNKILNILELNSICLNNSLHISKYLNNFLFSWDHIFTKKIIFSGKGFKIRKKQNFIFLFFNRAHASLLICNSLIAKKIHKHKMLFFFKNEIIYKNTLKFLIDIRPANIFTKRGLRFSRQMMWKRKGKGGMHT